MTTRSTWYAHQCIAASGLAVMDSRIAWQLRPDLWSGAQDCGITFRKQQSVDGARRLVATFPTYGDVQVYARSLDNIENRLLWIVGEAPTEIVEWQPEVPAVSPQMAAKRAANQKEIERLETLRKIAVEVPPSHDCSRRREILEARRELGMQ
ncbi:hypothetical protein AB6Q56_08820 [Dechloromonas sp. ARDL1]|uniref:hypothetical protein n=1 Tax=Dechloromonas sp. ARDL1 TaxID=3322121 RepID=UPI003DA6EF3E